MDIVVNWVCVQMQSESELNLNSLKWSAIFCILTVTSELSIFCLKFWMICYRIVHKARHIKCCWHRAQLSEALANKINLLLKLMRIDIWNRAAAVVCAIIPLNVRIYISNRRFNDFISQPLYRFAQQLFCTCIKLSAADAKVNSHCMAACCCV